MKKAEYFDLVFPLKLRPLTYGKPETMELEPGSIVLAELKKSMRRALALRVSEEAPPQIKEIQEIVEKCALSPALLKLLKWMAEYYMADPGSVLKVMYGEDLFENPKRKEKASSKGEIIITETAAEDIDKGHLEKIFKGGQGFGAFLYKAPSTSYERDICSSLLNEFLNDDGKGAIILVPELARISSYKDIFESMCGGRLAVIHGELTKTQRLRAYRKVLSGQADIVLGTRLAVFAPLRKASLVIVTEEENPNYKNEEGVRFHARDVAVRRASFEGARVLLSSICPSAESYMNSLKEKYELISVKKEEARKRVRVINMRKASLASASISEPLKKALAFTLLEEKPAAIILNRLGHSVPFCEDCGYVERCPSCRIALTLHKKGKALRCHYCGFEKRSGETCPNCGGPHLKMLGAGVERLEEELKEMNLPAPSLLMGGNLLIGTRAVLKELGDMQVETAGLLQPELAFYHPNFRSRERVFQEFMYLAEKLSPKGTLYVQTMEPELIRDMKELDYEKFIEGELAERKALGYPPYTKLALISLAGAKEGEIKLHVKGAQVLGPAPRLTKRGKRVLGILVKAQSAKALRAAVKELLTEIRAKKITVDIDPA